MTSVAFIMGVVPLVFSSGAGAEIRQAMGIAVFAGMLGVTLFGLFLTPVFYVVVGNIVARLDGAPRPLARGAPARTGRRGGALIMSSHSQSQHHTITLSPVMSHHYSVPESPRESPSGATRVASVATALRHRGCARESATQEDCVASARSAPRCCRSSRKASRESHATVAPEARRRAATASACG